MEPIASLAFSNGDRSGFLSSSIGVGTVTIKILHSFISSRLDV